MQKAFIEAIQKLISEKKVEVPQERFQWFLDSILENIEISTDVKKAFFIAPCEDLLQEFLDCVMPFHIDPINSSDVGKSKDAVQKMLEGFVPTDPTTWCALKTHAATYSETELRYELPLEKTLYKKLHPEDVLAFVPKTINMSSRFAMRKGLENAIVSLPLLGYRTQDDAEEPAIVSNLPFVTVFQDLDEDMRLKPSHIKRYLDVFLDFPFDETLISEIIKARSCTNFLESPLAPDPSFNDPEVFQIKLSDDNVLDTKQSSIKNSDTDEDLLTNNLKSTYLLTQYLLHEKDTIESKVLFGLTHTGTMLIALESCWQYVQLMHYNSEGYYQEISKEFPVPREVHNYFMLKIKQALLKLLYTSQEDLPEELQGHYSLPEMHDMPDDFVQMSRFPGQEAFVQNEGINMLFDKAFVATIGQCLGRAFSSMLDKACDDCLVKGNPQELGEEGLSPTNYNYQFIEGHVKPLHWHASRAVFSRRVIGLSLLGMDYKRLIQGVSCLNEEPSLFPTDNFSYVYLQADPSYFAFAFEMYVGGENIFQHKLRESMHNIYALVNEMDPDMADEERNEDLEKSVLHKALKNLGIDSEIICKSDPQNEATRETYLSKLLSFVAVDLFAITPIRTIPSVFAKNFSNKILYRSIVENTPFKENAVFYEFLKDTVLKNEKEIVATLKNPSKNIFELGLMGFTHSLSDVLKPFGFSNSALTYLDLLHAITQVTASNTSRDYLLFKNTLEISGLSLDLVEFTNYLTDHVSVTSKGLKEALSFFVKFEGYIDSNLDSACLKYSDFKNNIISKADFKKLQKAVNAFATNKDKANKLAEFEIVLAPFEELLVKLVEKIIFHAETCLVLVAPENLCNSSDPSDIIKHYFFDAETPDLDPIKIAQNACDITKIIFECRNIDRSDRSPSCIQNEISKIEETMLPKEIIFENLLQKLEQWPFGEASLLDQRLSLLYAILFFHEIVTSTQFAIIDDLLV